MPSATLRLTEADLAEAARLHKSLGRGHRYWRDLLVTAPFVWLVVLSPIDVLSEPLALLVAVIGALLGSCIYLIWRLWRMLPWRRRKGIILPELQVIVWTEAGLSTTSRFGTAAYRWTGFKQWTADRGMVLLYRDTNAFQILPRRVFVGLVEILMMENFLTAAGVRRVGPKRHRTSEVSEYRQRNMRF